MRRGWEVGVKIHDGRWKMEDSRWKIQDGRWKIQDSAKSTEWLNLNSAGCNPVVTCNVVLPTTLVVEWLIDVLFGSYMFNHSVVEEDRGA
jgi:hypothetical protein